MWGKKKKKNTGRGSDVTQNYQKPLTASPKRTLNHQKMSQTACNALDCLFSFYFAPLCTHFFFPHMPAVTAEGCQELEEGGGKLRWCQKLTHIKGTSWKCAICPARPRPPLLPAWQLTCAVIRLCLADENRNFRRKRQGCAAERDFPSLGQKQLCFQSCHRTFKCLITACSIRAQKVDLKVGLGVAGWRCL